MVAYDDIWWRSYHSPCPSQGWLMFRGLKKLSRYQSKDVNETILQKKWLGHVAERVEGDFKRYFFFMLPCILSLLDVASGPQTFWRYAEFVRLVASALAWALSPIRHVHSSLSHHQMEGADSSKKTQQQLLKIHKSHVLKSCVKKKWNHNHQKQLVSKTQFWKVFGRYLERNFGCLKSQQLPSLPRGYLQQPSRPCWHHAILVLLQNLHVVLCNMIMYDYVWVCVWLHGWVLIYVTLWSP